MEGTSILLMQVKDIRYARAKLKKKLAYAFVKLGYLSALLPKALELFSL